MDRSDPFAHMRSAKPIKIEQPKNNKSDKFHLDYVNEQISVIGETKELKELKKKLEKSLAPSELTVHNQVCKYLKAQYPNVMFLSDFAAGMKMSIGMASRQNVQKSNHAFPDLMIFEPKGGSHGLFIEIKKDDSIYYKGTFNLKPVQHVLDQRDTIRILRQKGYQAVFGCGFEECKQLIDLYLNQ